jgi:hypothetical protein
MRNPTKLAIIGCSLVLLGSLVGFGSGAAFTERAWRDDAVDQGFGYYSEFDGSWYWKQDLRAALTDKRGWVLCPFCAGEGEFFVGAPTLMHTDPPELAEPKDPAKDHPWMDPTKPTHEM